MKVICAYCKSEFEKRNGDANRAIKLGLKLYCNRTCFGLGSRDNKTIEQKKLEKSLYDKEYKIKNLEEIKKKKADYFQKTYDPKKAAIKRKERMPYHVECCRQPEYKAKKHEYDIIRNAKNAYGEFWESALLINKIAEIIPHKEMREINNLNNKTQKRKRKWKTKRSQNCRLTT